MKLIEKSKKSCRTLAIAMICSAAPLLPNTATAQDAQTASWTVHELDFQYMGVTARYTCSGLQGEMRKILLQLGARKDRFMVSPGNCGGFDDRPSRIAGVHIKVATLQPVAAASAAPAVGVQWKAVTVGGYSSEADCELIEQVKSDILPLFSTRNVKPESFNCIPNEEPTVPATLTLEVLSPAAPAP